MKLAVVTAATKSYLHAWPQCVRSIATAAAHITNGHFIFATDHSDESKQAEETLRAELPEGWAITVIRLAGMEDDAKDYQKSAQLRIAALQGAALHTARVKIRPDFLWSVESDNIVPANALRVLQWTLSMPHADGSPLYAIAAGTYQNGLFLGGRGTYQNPIAEDFLPTERKLKPRLKLCLNECEKRLGKVNLPPPSTISEQPISLAKWQKEKASSLEKEQRRHQRLMKCVKASPPDGNIWEVIAKHGWHPRGWLDYAYPGIGEGAIVPSDWCGLGCTLLDRRALALADFAGYDGGGTQDLFLCFRRWRPAGLRIACVPHVACDHVKKDPAGKITHHIAYHEPEGPYQGHLRARAQEWIPV